MGLQAGLFIYNIFGGFFTPFMVSVAKSFDATIKICLFVFQHSLLLSLYSCIVLSLVYVKK